MVSKLFHQDCKHDYEYVVIHFFVHSDVNVYFMHDVFYASEAELRIPVSVGKSKRIATPLTLRLVPLSGDDVASLLNINIITQDTCPDKCSCECQISTSEFGMFGKIYNSAVLWF